jgi:hypothetical protein
LQTETVIRSVVGCRPPVDQPRGERLGSVVRAIATTGSSKNHERVAPLASSRRWMREAIDIGSNTAPPPLPPIPRLRRICRRSARHTEVRLDRPWAATPPRFERPWRPLQPEGLCVLYQGQNIARQMSTMSVAPAPDYGLTSTVLGFPGPLLCCLLSDADGGRQPTVDLVITASAETRFV